MSFEAAALETMRWACEELAGKATPLLSLRPGQVRSRPSWVGSTILRPIQQISDRIDWDTSPFSENRTATNGRQLGECRWCQPATSLSEICGGFSAIEKLCLRGVFHPILSISAECCIAR
jgi:hypothetical protein